MKKRHENATVETDQVLAEETVQVADLDVAKPSGTTVKDQLVAACHRALEVLPDHEILVREQLIAAVQRAESKPAKGETKEARAVEMLREGATVAQLSEAFGWQRHTCHGFLAGTIKRKLGLTLTSTKVDGVRMYQIVGLQNY